MPSSLLAVECREAVSRSSHSWAPDYALGGTAAAAWALSAEALDELEGIQDDFKERLNADGPEAAWKGFLDFRNEPGTWDGYEEKTRQNFIRRTPAQLANFNANANNRTRLSDMARIKQSTLVIRGVDTSLYDMRMSEIVAANITGARFLILEDAGHMSPLTHPTRIAREIIEHIEAANISA